MEDLLDSDTDLRLFNLNNSRSENMLNVLKPNAANWTAILQEQEVCD